MTPDQLLRRDYLAWLLRFADEMCPDYAKRAAIAYEKNAPALFKGLADRFNSEWSLLNAQRVAQ